MTRKEMVDALTAKLEKLNDAQLVDAIVRYFEENRTLPGEKALKDQALALKAELDGNAITGLLSHVRADLVEEFASRCVKEVKLRNVHVLNETKKNRDADGLKASDLPMVLADTQPTKMNAMKNIYGMDAVIPAAGGTVCVGNAPAVRVELADLPAGFVKNHTMLPGMSATVVATDYSNGKFANMSYLMLVDLSQTLVA